MVGEIESLECEQNDWQQQQRETLEKRKVLPNALTDERILECQSSGRSILDVVPVVAFASIIPAASWPTSGGRPSNFEMNPPVNRSFSNAAGIFE